MATLKKTETVTYHTFAFTEQEVDDLLLIVGGSSTDTTTSLSTYRTLKSALDQSEEG